MCGVSIPEGLKEVIRKCLMKEQNLWKANPSELLVNLTIALTIGDRETRKKTIALKIVEKLKKIQVFNPTYIHHTNKIDR